jgi:hypothetical protein
VTATCVGLRLVGGAFHRLWGGKVHVLRAKVAGLTGFEPILGGANAALLCEAPVLLQLMRNSPVGS